MRTRIIAVVFCLFALSRLGAADEVIISEFMASNMGSLLDEDGDSSDWIEIYNAGTNTVNLGGWYLTDNDGNLTKWQFPPTNLAPHTFLVVFASGKDRRVPGAPLHTGFSLDADGEYLALVRPNGVTVASEFGPEFPEQYGDVAYGFLMSGASTTLLGSGANARAFVPSADIGAGWRASGFNDAGWQSGTTGAGYGTNYTGGTGLNIGAAMSNANASAYVRVPFNVPNPLLYEALTLRMKYDDGFIAYLNGTEVARRNAPAAATWNSVATAAHPPLPDPLLENFEGGASAYTLNQYGAAPAPVVQPGDAGSTGSFLRLLHDGVNAAFNSVAFARTAPGLYETIVADFDFRMTNAANNPADGFAFMLIPTSVYGTSGAGINIGNIAVEEPNFAGVFAVGVDLYPHDTQNDISAHWDGLERQNVTLARPAYELVTGVFHHLKVTLQHVSGGARVTVVLTPNINGTPGTPITAINNLFIAGLNPYECRVQIAGRTGGLNVQLDLDNLNVQFQSAPLDFEAFDITQHLNLLVPGTNVLAIHGLNLAANDVDFLVSPEIVAADFSVGTNANYIAPPTPGSWNNTTLAGRNAPVTFLPAPGVYSSDSINVSMATTAPGGQIRYTLDGKAPTLSSPLYTGPIAVTTNAAFRARVFGAGRIDSEVTAANYILLDPGLTNFTSNLPLVIIDHFATPLADNVQNPAYIVCIDTNGPDGRSTLNPQLSTLNFSGRAGLELHGQSSLGFPKQSLNLEIHDETDDDEKVSLFGLPKGSDWTLYAPYTDKTLMNDFLTYELHEAMGHYAVRRRYVEVFRRSSPGKLRYNDYRGIYILLEKIRIDKNRVDIAELDDNDNAEPEISGGYIWKKDKDSPGDVNFFTSSGQLLKYHDPKGNRLTPEQRQWLVDHLNQFEAALYGANYRDPVSGYARFIDIGSFVDQHWIVEFPKNIDGYRLSNYMSKDRNGKIRMDPIWDWNLSWGNANYLEGGYTNGWYYPLIGAYNDIWLSQLRTDPDFYQRIVDRWGELRTNLFSLTNLMARVDAITNRLHEAQARDFVRWPRLGAYVWPNPDGNTNGAPVADPTRRWDVDFQNPTNYAGIIEQQKKWITGRHLWIESQFLIAPTLSRPAGMVTSGDTVEMSAPLGTIFYTLDGTDPRASGGGHSLSARPYAAPITITSNTHLVARAFLTNGWSPSAAAVYVIATPTLAITEIMYHPADPPPGSPWDADDFEFIEIKNTGTNALNLRGARLAGGIDFTFRDTRLASTGSPTTNNFDSGGTTFTASTLDSGPAPQTTSGGPSGDFLRLITGGNTATTRNRIAFAQTAPGGYARVTADFDFRAATVLPSSTGGVPTVQNFDDPGTAYATRNYAAFPVAVLPADAGSSGQFLRLVPADYGQIGVAAFDTTAPTPWNTVIATFDFRIKPIDEVNQADGMGFGLLNTAIYGATGAEGAFTRQGATFDVEDPALIASLGVGIDVYNNGAPNDPNNNHVSLHWNQAMFGSAVTPPFDLSNGRFHRAQVIVRFINNNALVTVRMTQDIHGTPGETVTLFDNFVINGVPSYSMRAAFAARTGGYAAAHDIDNVDVQFTSDPLNWAGLSMVLLPATVFGTDGAGSSKVHFEDAPAAPNTFALDLAFNPQNAFNAAALYWNGASVFSRHVSAMNLDNGQFHHARIVLEAAPSGTYATLLLTPDIFGAPGTPIAVASNFFIQGFQPADVRLEFAGRNSGIDTALDVENVLVTYDASVPEVLAAGECILVVKNRAAFESRYGTGFRIAGEYSGQLDNAGDHIVLLGPLGEPILDFTYSDDWFRLTDGVGFSLVNKDPLAPNTTYGSITNWRSSTYEGGSPGAPDPAPITVAAILLNEALASPVPPATDRIELFNPTAAAADISGWFLSDDFFTPKKFRIPPGTSIASGGFAVFTEADFNAGANAFALDRDSDEVFLFSADTNGTLNGYVHGFDFSGSEPGVSFGRYVDSVGAEHFPAQIATTFGASNAGPRVGPIVISEIMYRPPDVNGQDDSTNEFIELANVAPAATPLYRTDSPTDTWHLRDAVDFDFPPNVTLAPGERILVVNFDPANAAMLAAFRAHYGVSADVRVFGPYAGKLGNTNDDIHLNKPVPDTTGSIYVRVDQVKYSSALPWPTGADGTGLSLHRIAATAFGNDPGNWTAAAPTPGVREGPADTDGDGLPDWWETRYGLSPTNATDAVIDSDGDGMINRDEFIAGTHPLDPQNVLKLSVTATNARVLQFIARSNVSYTVQYRTNLSAAAWRNLTNIPADSSAARTIVVQPAVSSPPAPEEFYRVVTPMAP